MGPKNLIPIAKLDYHKELVLTVQFGTPRDSGYSQHIVNYDPVSGNMNINHTSIDFDGNVQDDLNEKLRGFVRDNRSVIQSGLGLLTDEQKRVVKRFLDELEREPSGLLRFLGI